MAKKNKDTKLNSFKAVTPDGVTLDFTLVQAQSLHCSKYIGKLRGPLNPVAALLGIIVIIGQLVHSEMMK